MTELSYKLIEEIGKDRYIEENTPVYMRLRLIKDLISQGADPNYVKVDREYNDISTPLEQALINGLYLHAALLIHEGARMYDIEKEAMSGCRAPILFRLLPQLRQYHKYSKSITTEPETDEMWVELVDSWMTGPYFQLEKDPEIANIIFG